MLPPVIHPPPPFDLPLGVAIALAAALSLAFALVVVRNATRWGLQDLPNERSSHRTATPRGGGIGIVLAFALVAPVALPGGLTAGAAVWAVGGAALFLALIGFADDLRGLGLGIRLVAQAGAVLVLGWALAPDAWPHGATPGLAAATLGLALLLAGVWWINLFNFMDGIDGLAAAQALFMLVAGQALSDLSDGSGPQVAGALLAGAVAGFLLVNWAPAKIFMGDAGSLFLGFSLLAMAAHDIRHADAAVWPWLILGGTFIADATVTLARRALTGQNVIGAHRSHLYQRLSRQWGSHSRVTLVYSLVNLCWLFPLAWLALRAPDQAPLILGIAWLPLALLAWRLGAGLKET